MNFSEFNNTNKILENYSGGKKCKNMKIENLIIDSRDRNTTKYPNVAEYTIDLPTTYKCIHSIELINAYVRGSSYNIIENYNDTLYITESTPVTSDESVYPSTHPIYPDGVYTTSGRKLKAYDRSSFIKVIIPPGVYTEIRDGYSSYKANGGVINAQTHSTLEAATSDPDADESNENIDIPINSLARKIAMELSNAADGETNLTDNDYTVKYDSLTEKYTITSFSDTVFHMLFFDNEKPHGNYRTEVESNYSFPLYNQTSKLTNYFKTEKERTDYILDKGHNFTKTLGGGSVDRSDTTVTSTFRNSLGNTIFVGPPTRKEVFYGDMERQYPKKATIAGTVYGGSIGKVLGFKNYNLADAKSYTAPLCANFKPEPYVILKIPQLKRYQSLNKNAHKTFAIIPLDMNDRYDFSLDRNIKAYFQPLPKLSQLSLRFTRQDGTLYDFNGRDHTLVFKIITSRQSDKYCRKN